MSVPERMPYDDERRSNWRRLVDWLRDWVEGFRRARIAEQDGWGHEPADRDR